MIDFLLNFLGVKIEAAQEVSSVAVQFRHSSWMGWIVTIALLLAFASWWTYKNLPGHKELAPKRRRWLNILRTALFLLMLFLLLRPVLSFTIENRIRRTLIALFDDSGSMEIKDAREDPNDLKRSGIAKGAIKKLDQNLGAQDGAGLKDLSRIDVVKNALANPEIKLMEQLKAQYDMAFFKFDRSVSPTEEDKVLGFTTEEAEGRQFTSIGDAIRDVIARKRGQPVAGIMLVTDGASNAGSEPREAAEAAGREGMPLYIYGVGITSPRDISVTSVFTQDVAFKSDEVTVTVRMRAQGLNGRKTKMSLKLGSEVVTTQEIEITDDGEKVIPLKFTPEKEGEFELTASIPPTDDEVVKDNNSASQKLRVIDRKINVLFVEQSPRWEFRHAESSLLRDRRITAKFWLTEADPALSKAPNSPLVDKFPTSKEDLFKCDLLIIGDVDPKIFTQEQIGWISEFVSKFGGACIFLAGQKHNPADFKNMEFAKMLPVEWENSASTVQRALAGRATTLALTAQGRTSPLLKLAGDDQENAEAWEKFPQVHWINRVTRAKAGAQVLLEDTDPAKANRFGRMPAIALQQYGLGQVLYLGTDDMWRWRQEGGVVQYSLFWGQVVQRMALAHLLGGSKRTQLSVDKQRYVAGDRVTVFARLYDNNFEPVKSASVNGGFAVKTGDAPESARQEVLLRSMPGQPGMYRGEFVAVEPGSYKFSVESDKAEILEFDSIEPRFELGDTAMNELLLKEMAKLSGGDFFREENLADLPAGISRKDEKITRIIDADLWSSPVVFIVLFLIAMAEWFLRKKWELK